MKFRTAVIVAFVLAVAAFAFAAAPAYAGGEDDGCVTVIDQPAVAGFWANFSPNDNQGPFEGPPSYPVDERGTWHVHENGGPGQDESGVFQVGNGNGDWFYRQQAVAEVSHVECPDVKHEPVVTATSTCREDGRRDVTSSIVTTDGATSWLLDGQAYTDMFVDQIAPRWATGVVHQWTFLYDDDTTVTLVSEVNFEPRSCPVTPPPSCENDDCGPPCKDGFVWKGGECVKPPVHHHGGPKPPKPPVKHELPFTGLPTGVIAALGALSLGAGLLLKRRFLVG